MRKSYAESNSSFLIELTAKSMSKFFYNIAAKNAYFLIKAAFIMYPTGGAEDFRGGGGGGGGGSHFFRAKKGGYENCLNISWGDAYFL